MVYNTHCIKEGDFNINISDDQKTIYNCLIAYDQFWLYTV